MKMKTSVAPLCYKKGKKYVYLKLLLVDILEAHLMCISTNQYQNFQKFFLKKLKKNTQTPQGTRHFLT